GRRLRRRAARGGRRRRVRERGGGRRRVRSRAGRGRARSGLAGGVRGGLSALPGALPGAEMTLALVTEPGRAGTAHVAEVADESAEGRVVVRPLEIGVCGTDREISEGHFGIPAEGGSLVLGHELLGVVEHDGHGFARGDLVTATVRRPCGHCTACAEGSPDSCLTGDYSERGITRLHGFARERFAEDPAELIAIPASLGRLGVL